MKRHALSVFFALLSAGALAGVAAAQSPAPASHGAENWGMLQRYCLDCHNFEDWAGGVAFDTMNPEGIPDDAAVWEEALKKLRGRLMPPAGEVQPEQQEIDAFVAWMEAELDGAAHGPRAGHVPVQRLTRTEYAIAVKGLVDVDVDPEALLPTEIEVEGFENIAEALSVSPAFLEQYISAARHVARLAIGEPEPKQASVYYLSPGGRQATHQDGFPLGTRGGMRFDHTFPADGEYRFNILDVDAGLYPRALEFEHTLVMLIDGEEVFRTQIGGEDDLRLVDVEGPAGRQALIERISNIPAHVPAGGHEVLVTFIERSWAQTDHVNGGGVRQNVPRLIDGIEVNGPFEPSGLSMSASREKVFVCYPESADQERACAETIAADLARRAYRRPATEADVAELMPFYETGRASAGGFDTGIEQLLTAVLASPRFLYRAVTPSPDMADADVYPLDDLELASRLSFFLWSQGPDDALIDLAAAGTLSDPDVLDAQVRRMLADDRASAVVDTFALNWLNLDDLNEVQPEDRSFNAAMRENFEREIELFLASVLLEDRSVVDLVTADYTFLNENLARHYGVDGVFGPQWRRVTLEDETRWGLLGKGAVLLRTSYGDRTSPVLRGAWVLEKIWGTPPAPPPPNVETDLSTPDGDLPTTVRARLEAHRADASCNACHGIIDPPGLALENFDVTGRWRDIDRTANAPIDASSVLSSGAHISGPADLRDLLARRPEQFVQNLTEKLMMHALGREIEHHDMPQVRAIVRDAADDGYTLSAIVLGIVGSDAFRLQAAPELASLSEG